MLDTIAGRTRSQQESHTSLPCLHLPRGRQVALLVNSLGATTQMELLVAGRAAIRYATDVLQVKRPDCSPLSSRSREGDNMLLLPQVEQALLYC